MNRLRQRLQLYGVSTLSTHELLSLALSSSAKGEHTLNRIEALLGEAGSLHALLQFDLGQLSQAGLSPVKAAQLQAVLELARRLTRPCVTERYHIITPEDAARLVMPEMAFLDHEEMRVLLLDAKNCVVANLLLYQGTIDTAVFRVAEVFRPAVTRKCSRIVVCHNHPSGNTQPSTEDIEFTQQCVQAGRLLDIEVVDHLIIGTHQFLSLKERLLWK